MNLIEFKNKPDKTTPVNANNLNYNFKELKNEFGKISEVGIQNGVYYTKFSNGKLIQSFNQSIKVTDTRNSGGLSYYSGNVSVELPISYKDTNFRCSSNIILANMNYFANSYVTVESANEVNVSLATTEPNASRVIQVFVIGEWK